MIHPGREQGSRSDQFSKQGWNSAPMLELVRRIKSWFVLLRSAFFLLSGCGGTIQNAENAEIMSNIAQLAVTPYTIWILLYPSLFTREYLPQISSSIVLQYSPETDLGNYHRRFHDFFAGKTKSK